MQAQYNQVTGQEYQGRNQAELLHAKNINGYTSDAWITFIQARLSGRQVKKGSHGMHIFKGFASFTDTVEQDGKVKAKTSSRPVGFAVVFNLDQTQLIEQKKC